MSVAEQRGLNLLVGGFKFQMIQPVFHMEGVAVAEQQLGLADGDHLTDGRVPAEIVIALDGVKPQRRTAIEKLLRDPLPLGQAVPQKDDHVHRVCGKRPEKNLPQTFLHAVGVGNHNDTLHRESSASFRNEIGMRMDEEDGRDQNSARRTSRI